MAPFEFNCTLLSCQLLLWSILVLTQLFLPAPCHTSTSSTHTSLVPWSPLEPRVLKHSSIWFIIKEYEVYDELSLFYILQWMKKTVTSTHRKVEQKETQSAEKWEVRGQLTIQNPKPPSFPCLLLSLYYIKNFNLCPSWSFFGCVAVKLSVCSPCGESRVQKQHCASKNISPGVNTIYASPVETELRFLSILSHYQETQTFNFTFMSLSWLL